MFDIRNFFTKEIMVVACTQLCFGVIGALIVQGIFTHRSTPPIATVNVTGIVDSFVKETTKRSLTPAEMKQNVTVFGEHLNQVVARVANQKHLILMMREAVIAGSPDLTMEVEEIVKEEMRR